MRGAEFDIARRRLGLSIAETAAVCGVTEKTVNRWMRGEQPIRPDAWHSLDLLEAAMQDAADQAVEIACDATAAGPFRLPHFRSAEVMRRHYPDSPLPLGAQAMMTAWTAEALEDEGIAAEIVWVE
jgi:transcriptional regulator with XRE-family HTH domain